MLLITGATGTVGKLLIQELEGHRGVRALIRDAAQAPALQRRGVETAVGSFEDDESLRAALTGVSTLFLLSPPGDEELVRAQTRVVDLAAALGVGRVVKLSSIAAEEEPDARIIRAHRAVERHIEAGGMAWTHLRPHWFMENELGQAGTIATEGALVAPDVGRITTVAARDIAAVAARVLTSDGHAGRAYVLTGPDALSYADMAATFGRVLERDVRWDRVALDDAQRAMVDAGLPPSLATGFTEIMARYREGGVAAEVSPDVEAVLGRPPRSFADFVREHREHFAAERPALAA